MDAASIVDKVNDDWFNKANRDTFIEVAEDMLQVMNEDAVENCLDRLYHAVASDFVNG